MEFTGMGNLSRGTALAVLLLLPTLLVFYLQKRILKRRNFVTINGRSGRGSKGLVTKSVRRVLFLFCLSTALFIILIYITIIMGSFIKLWGENWAFTTEHIIYSYDVGFKTMLNTLLLALVSTPVTALLGVMVAFLTVRKKVFGIKALEFLSLLSYAIPGTVVGIGYVLAFNHSPFQAVRNSVYTGCRIRFQKCTHRR